MTRDVRCRREADISDCGSGVGVAGSTFAPGISHHRMHASRCFELLNASRDASDAEAGSLRLVPDSSRPYVFAMFCAASNT